MLNEDSKLSITTPRNLADQVYDALEKAILNGEFLPGEEVPETLVAENLGVSATPVREAINRLAGDGLIIKATNKRPRVIQLTRKEVQDLYDVRTALEVLGISTAASSITSEGIQDLRELQERGEGYFRADEFSAYMNYDREFHSKVMSFSENTLVMDFMNKIRNRVMLCVLTTVRIRPMHEQAVKQHCKMIELLAQRDAQGAEEAMKEHIQMAKEALLHNYQGC